MDSTEKRVQELRDIFPDADENVLLELLVSCEGSVSQAEFILNESFPNHKKRKSSNVLYQSSIKKLFQSPSDQLKKPIILNKSNSRTIRLYTKEDIETTLAPYVSFEKNFLPEDVSNNLLQHLLLNQDKCKPNEFYLFGNKCISSNKTGLYSSNEEFKNKGYDIIYNGSAAEILPYNDDLTITQLLIEDYVQTKLRERPKLKYQEPNWKGDVTLCNIYENGTNKIDWHSDRLTHIGPHNTIASLSLGATREFKLRRIHKPKDEGSPIYSINLPHNTLLVMHPGCQEEFKHCITPDNKPLQIHHISKSTRVNLTYRYYPEKYYKHLPVCKCGLTMLLRRSYKDVKQRGKYFWSCEGVYKEHDCGAFKWADFSKENLLAENEEDCSFWIAEDDLEKRNHLMNEENKLKERV